MDLTSSSLASSNAGSLSESSLTSSMDTSALDVDMDVMDCLVQDVKNLSEALNRLNLQLLTEPISKSITFKQHFALSVNVLGSTAQ